jgi:hypothetical protein
MKQSAVEWLMEEMFKSKLNLYYEKLLNQAKEMEKQQIIDACQYGNNFEQGDLNCENYYNKTFKQQLK